MSNDESAVNILLDALTVGPDAPPKKMDANAVRYPTNVDDIAKALSQLCTKFAGPTAQQIPPTLHFSAMEAMTKYDMCLVMARCLRAVGEEAETEHLEPEYEIDPNAATSRPRHCKLDLSVIKGLGIDTECTSFEHVRSPNAGAMRTMTDLSCPFSSAVVERVPGRGTCPKSGMTVLGLMYTECPLVSVSMALTRGLLLFFLSLFSLVRRHRS